LIAVLGPQMLGEPRDFPLDESDDLRIGRVDVFGLVLGARSEVRQLVGDASEQPSSIGILQQLILTVGEFFDVHAMVGPAQEKFDQVARVEKERFNESI
jgi:hypothetical protein